MFAKCVALQVLLMVCCSGGVCANPDPTAHGVRDSQDPSCLHKSPIQEWRSKLLVEDLLSRSNKRKEEEHVDKAEAHEKRRNTKRRGSLQLLIQGHNRTNGKINARTRYQVELVNSMVREVKALIIIAPVNQTACGLGTLVRNKSQREKESMIFNDDCHLRAETLLPAKAKRDFTWMTPGCGCLNVSAHFAFYTNNKMTIMNPKRSKDALPNKIVCVGPTLSRAEQMTEVRRRIMKQRQAKLQRKRRGGQRQKRPGHQLSNGGSTKKMKTSSANAGRNSIGSNRGEETEILDQETIREAEVIFPRNNGEDDDNELELQNQTGREGEESPGEEDDDADEDEESDETSESDEDEDGDEDEESDETSESDEDEDADEDEESDETSESNEDEDADEDEKSDDTRESDEENDETCESEEEDDEEDSSPAPATEGNHPENETDANTKKRSKKRLRGPNKISKLKGDKKKKMAKRRRHLQKNRRGAKKQRMDGLKNKNKGARGNFRGLRLCCRQGIKQKKMIVYSHPHPNEDPMRRCGEASAEMLTWVKKKMKVSERFCSRRFTQCCLGWRGTNKEVGANNSIQE